MKEKRFDNFLIISTVLFTVLMIFHRKFTSRQIFLNSFIPIFIFFLGIACGLIILYFIRKFGFKINESIRIYFTDILVLIKSLFLSIVIFGSLSSWLFDYVNLRSTYNKELIVEKCKVYNVSIVSSGTHNSIGFIFLGKDKSMNNFISTETMRQAYKRGRNEGCYLSLSIRKGLLTSYIIEDFYFTCE